MVLLSLVYSQQPRFQRIGRRLIWLKRLLGYVALLFDNFLKPVSWILSGVVVVLRAFGTLLRGRERATEDRPGRE
jgi:hypothetical protein